MSKCKVPRLGKGFLTRVLYSMLCTCMYFKLFSVSRLPLTVTYSFNDEMGLQKRSILYSLYSMTKTNYAAKLPLTVQLLKEKKKAPS